MSGTTKKLQLLGKLQSSVYILSEGETLEDAPIDADVVIDPYSDEAVFPEGGSGGATTWEDLGTIGYMEDTQLSGHELTYADEDAFVITEPFELVPDKEYEVWVSTDRVPASGSTGIYTLTTETIYEDDIAIGVALGNTSVMGGTIESDAPFIVFMPTIDLGYPDIVYGLFITLDGSTTVHFRYISGPVAITRPIPAKYLPGHLVVNFVTNDLTFSDITTDKTFEEIYAAMSTNPNGVVGLFSTSNDNSSIIVRPTLTDDGHYIAFASGLLSVSDNTVQLINVRVYTDDSVNASLNTIQTKGAG